MSPVISKQLGKNFELRFFYLCFFVYIVIHVGFAAELHLKREIPWEPDDHYHYISKASNLLDCLANKCPALDDIHTQTKPLALGEDLKQNNHINLLRNREKHRFLLAYHPLYSSLLAGLRVSGLAFEQGQVVVDVLGTILFGIGLSLFTSRLFGRGSAALSLLTLSVLVLPYWGTHYVNPWHFSNGFIFLSWWALARQQSSNFKLVTLFSILSIVSHPIGVILYGMSTGAIILLYLRSWNKSCVLHFLCMCVFLVLYFFTMDQLGREGVQLTDTYLMQGGILQIVGNNFDVIVRYLKILSLNASPIVLVICTFITLATILQRFRDVLSRIIKKWLARLEISQFRKIVIFSLVMLGMFLISLVEPHDVGLFLRVGPLIVVFLLGLFFSVTWSVVERMLKGSRFHTGYEGWSDREGSGTSVIQRNGGVERTCIALIMLSLLLTMSYNAVRLCYASAERILGHNMVFIPETVEKLLEDSQADSRILYNLHSIYNMRKSWTTYNNRSLVGTKVNTGAEAATNFVLIYGGVNRGAVLSHLVLSTVDESKWIDESISHLVTLSPSTVILGSDIVLHSGDSVRIENNNDEDFGGAEIYIQNEEGPVLISVKGAETFQVEFPSNSQRWVKIPSNILSGTRIIEVSTQPIKSYTNRLKDIVSFSRSIWIQSMSYRTRIGGVRIGSQSTYWPWDQAIKITVNNYASKRVDREIVYKTNSLSPTHQCQVGKIVSDRGSIVVARLMCPSG